jgi:DNA-binding SARP family transcriptional activator
VYTKGAFIRQICPAVQLCGRHKHSMTSLSLALLGSLNVSRDGQPISGFESAKVRALLVYLAVESDRPHHRDALAGLLWPEQPDQVARNNLRQALANLRQVLGDRTAASSRPASSGLTSMAVRRDWLCGAP